MFRHQETLRTFYCDFEHVVRDLLSLVQKRFHVDSLMFPDTLHGILVDSIGLNFFQFILGLKTRQKPQLLVHLIRFGQRSRRSAPTFTVNHSTLVRVRVKRTRAHAHVRVGCVCKRARTRARWRDV